MKKLNIVLLLLFLLVFTNIFWSQENTNRLKTSYAFTIDNISDIDQLEKIKSEIENLEFIEKVKINAKGEQPSKAQIIVYVNEPKRTSEGQIMFEPSVLKTMILSETINLLDLQIANY